ncbi:MAG: CRISPR-associated endonuclease Cas2 [bacterium]|nr:CRISPR-associated endonuclease Cas2 [bacterium]
MSEQRTKHHARKLGSIERDVLNELSLGDLLYSFLLSARSTRIFYKLARERASYRYRRKRAIERLVALEYVRAVGARMSITKSGRSVLGETVSRTFNLLANKKWDHKWRIVTFDIPEKYAALRNKIRDILKEAGFVRLQHSVWVFPHECEEFVQL